MPWSKALKKVGHSVSDAILPTRYSIPEQFDLAEDTCNNANAEYKQYVQFKDIEALGKSISLLEQARAMIDESPSLLTKKQHTPVSDYLHIILRSRADRLRILFCETDEKTYLNQSIELLQYLFKHSTRQTPEKFAEAISLAQHLSDRYFSQSESNREDLDAALEAARSALSITKRYQDPVLEDREDDRVFYQVAQGLVQEPLDISRGVYCYQWGQSLQRRSTRLQDMSILSKARDYYTQAMQLLPNSHASYVANAIQLGICEANLLIFSTDISRIDQTVKLLSHLKVEDSKTGDCVRLKIAMSELFRGKFRHLSDLKDLDKAVEAALEAVNLSQSATILQFSATHLLVEVLQQRASMQRSQTDINLAKTYTEKIIPLIPSTDYTALSEAYYDLGNVLGAEFELFHKSENLSLSVQFLRAALEILPQNSIFRAVKLHSLYNGLQSQYEYTSDVRFLDEMIVVERQALAIARQLSVAGNTANVLNQLSSALASRYRITGDSEDMKEAVSFAETALASIPKGSQLYSDLVSGLASRLSLRYDRFSDIDDLNRAVSLISEAISLGSVNQRATWVHKSILATCLSTRFKEKQDLKDIDRAIALMREVNETSDMSYPTWLNELATYLWERFRAPISLDEKRKLLDEAVSHQTLAISLQSQSDPERAWYLMFLGNLELSRRDVLSGAENVWSSQAAIFTRSTEIFEKALAVRHTTPISRINIAWMAASCYIFLSNWNRSSALLHGAVLLFPKISPVALDQDDRQKRLHGLTQISAKACMTYVKLGDPDTGMEILDAGRGIMGKLAIRQYDHLPSLKAIDPSLHEQYIKLRQILSTPISSGKIRDLDVVALRQKNQKLFDEMEDKIRRLPGMEGFNQNLSSSQIKSLAREGPLVSFCEAIGNYFALIVTPDKIEVLHLPDLQEPAVDEKVPYVIGKDRLSLWPPSKRAAAAKKMKALLGWLWDAAVRPVLAHLNFLDRKQDDLLPRIWWITSGRLGLMPLHAAGRTSKASSENALDYVVSSYAPTCATLAFARQCQAKTETGHPKVALVSMPKTAGHTPLQTADEEQAVRDGFPVETAQEAERLVELIQPSAAEVLAKVRDGTVDIFHFCCHNEPDLADPSKTALLFGKDPTAATPDRLTIAQLRAYNSNNDLDLRVPRLAYLSGCCTAQQYDIQLLDESIHLASIFQLIGFPAVIGTLWEADNKSAVFIARTFYAELIRFGVSAGTQEPSSAASYVARALHTAIVTCRATKFGKMRASDDVLLWANFVHFGA